MALLQSGLRSGWPDAGRFCGEFECVFLNWLRTIIRRKRPQMSLEPDNQPTIQAEDNASHFEGVT